MESLSDLLPELEAFADPESFLELCREIKDGMVFYDRDVLVATVTSLFEGMAVGVLFAAALDGEEALGVAADAIRHLLRRLPISLRQGRFAMDAQAVLARFLELGVPSAQSAYESIESTFTLYLRGGRPPSDPERLLYQARLALDDGNDDAALERLAEVGLAVVHGYRVRPVWLRISGRMAGYVNGLFAVREALISHPFISYPLRPIEEERERLRLRHKIFDLDEIRRLRAGEDLTAPRDVGFDEVDVMWEGILAEGPVVRREDLDRLAREGRRVLYPLLTIVRAREFRRSKATFIALHHLVGFRNRDTVAAVLAMLAEIPAEDPLFAEGLRVLEAAGRYAREAVLDFAEAETSLAKKISLARLIGRYRGDERAFLWLLKMFKSVDWPEGKAELASSLGQLGDARALPVLRAALSGDKRKDTALERAILSLAARA